jgi:hypothetical protein
MTRRRRKARWPGLRGDERAYARKWAVLLRLSGEPAYVVAARLRTSAQVVARLLRECGFSIRQNGGWKFYLTPTGRQRAEITCAELRRVGAVRHPNGNWSER